MSCGPKNLHAEQDLRFFTRWWLWRIADGVEVKMDEEDVVPTEIGSEDYQKDRMYFTRDEPALVYM